MFSICNPKLRLNRNLLQKGFSSITIHQIGVLTSTGKYSEDIQNLPENAQIFVLTIFNRVWTDRCDIVNWKQLTVISILRQDRNPNTVESYRPRT